MAEKQSITAAESTVRDDESERLIQQLQSAVLEALRAAAPMFAEEVGKRQKRNEVTLERQREMLERSMFDALRPFMENIIELGGESGNAEIDLGVSFDVQNPAVVEFIQQHTIRLAGQIAETTVEAVRATIESGIEAGATGREIADAISEKSPIFGPARAESIARTESARAFVQGRVESWRQSGIVTGKRWLLAPGACPICIQLASDFNDRGEALPLDANAYDVGDTLIDAEGVEMKVDFEPIGGPPAHPNCRCDLIPEIQR